MICSRNDSADLRIYCADRKKVIQECRSLHFVPVGPEQAPLALKTPSRSDFQWIFTCNSEGI